MKTSERKAKFETSSGIEVKSVFTAKDSTALDTSEPSQFPFTRGVYGNMYRSRFWTMRQYAGFATAEESLLA